MTKRFKVMNNEEHRATTQSTLLLSEQSLFKQTSFYCRKLFLE